MLTPTMASEQPTDTLPVLAQYLHARLGPLPLRPPVAISFDVDDTLVDTKTSLAHGVRVGSQLAASLTSRVDPDELTDAYHAAFGVFWEHPADTGTYSLLSRPGARFRCCHRPVSPGRSPSEVGRRRGARGVGPFPSAPSRTVLDDFSSHGSPVVSSGWVRLSFRRGCSRGRPGR